MRTLPFTLLKDRSAFWADVEGHTLRWRDLLQLVLFITCACGIYGAALAGWRSPRLCMYVAIKLPFLFLATTAIVAVFNWMMAATLGSGLTFKSTIFIVFGAITVGAWILLGLVPVAFFFVLSGVPYAGSDAQLQYAHNAILMTHIVILAAAGVAGNVTLLGGLRRVVRARCPTGLLFVIWLTAFAFVGCQMSWILRPFVGSPFYPVVFMRPNCLERNFYEFLSTEVLPYLFGTL
jgi:hypothetical protein